MPEGLCWKDWNKAALPERKSGTLERKKSGQYLNYV